MLKPPKEGQVQMNFAYVLASDENDIYYEQMLVSLISLKHWNPDAYVCLVIDDDTADSFSNPLRKRHEVFVDEVKIIHFAFGKGKHYRSRFLKTTLRENLKGDYLYVDTDTIFCEKIDGEIFSSDVMGVDDHHQLPSNFSKWPEITKDIRKAGFSEKNIDHYVNGGVLWMKESEHAHRFFSLWHSLWLESVKRGIVADQPSLNEANKRLSKMIGILPGEYNCQISANLKYLHKAIIIHCFASTVSNVEKQSFSYIFLNLDFYLDIKRRPITTDDERLIFDAKSAFDGREFILLGSNDTIIYRTNLYGFIRCLFMSNRGRWLFNLMDKFVKAVVYLFWEKK